MKDIKILVSGIFLWIFSFYSISAQNSFQINEGERLLVGKYLEYFVDTTQQLGIHDVLELDFIDNNTDILNLGNTEHSIWIRFSVSSKTEKELFLEINAPLLSHLEVYEIIGDSIKLLFKGGSSKPFNERPIHSEDWLFELHMNQDIQSTIYIKGESYYPLQVPIAVSSKNKFLENKMLYDLFWGIYMGVMLFAFIYNLFIYLSVRDRSYLYYLIYILGTALFYLGLEGYGFQFIWSNIPEFNPLVPILINFTNIVITLFTFRFLRIKKDQKALYYLGISNIVIFILITGINLMGKYALSNTLSQMFSLLACIYFIVAGIVSLKRGIKTAKFFLIGWFAFLILVIIFILALNNVVPSNFFTTHGIFIGHMAEVVLLSFALADRINVLKTENEITQREIIFQLEENQKLQTMVNRELELKVGERTKEVVVQKERSEELLLNILPSQIAEELKDKRGQ